MESKLVVGMVGCNACKLLKLAAYTDTFNSQLHPVEGALKNQI
ncbi:MAG: hypothetical protein RRX93_05150 [Bacteroidales bacterium]